VKSEIGFFLVLDPYKIQSKNFFLTFFELFEDTPEISPPARGGELVGSLTCHNAINAANLNKKSPVPTSRTASFKLPF
jgi:hypothetical protein